MGTSKEFYNGAFLEKAIKILDLLSFDYQALT
jgi:hypothetical protein